MHRKCVSLNNQPCQARTALVNVNSNKLLHYLVTVSVNKSGGNCNSIYDPYAQVCASDKMKNMNIKVFNLMSRVNVTIILVQHQSCQCKCELNESVCYSNQKWNHDERRCECKVLDDWSSCKDDYMCNPSACNSECSDPCKINEYLDIKIIYGNYVHLIN